MKEMSTSKDRFTSKDTEPDVALNPAAYWQDVLKSKVNRLLEQKLGWNHSATVRDINVVVSATAVRSELPLTKRFEMEDDWQLLGEAEIAVSIGIKNDVDGNNTFHAESEVAGRIRDDESTVGSTQQEQRYIYFTKFLARQWQADSLL